MKTDPLATALREVAETKVLVKSLLVSAETCDYPRARLVLKALEAKVRELARLQTDLERELKPGTRKLSNICVVDFSQPAGGVDNSPRQRPNS